MSDINSSVQHGTECTFIVRSKTGKLIRNCILSKSSQGTLKINRGKVSRLNADIQYARVENKKPSAVLEGLLV